MTKRLLAALLAATTIIPLLPAGDIGSMDNFWRRGTMVDQWLAGGGGLITVPDYITDPSASFHYVKRPYEEEHPFADEMILVRVLGGWGSGSASDRAEDFAYFNGTELVFRKEKLIERIQPYIDNGYGEGLTLVMDNIPWGLAGDNPSSGEYGQNSPALEDEWMYWVGRHASQYLVEEFGDLAHTFLFRFGTETDWDQRFAGDALTYYNHYKECLRGLRHHLPSAKMGPGNFTTTLNKAGTANLKDFLAHVASNPADNADVAFISASAYFNATDTGMDKTANQVTEKKLNYMSSLTELYGETVLSDVEWYIDEFGVKSDSEEPGAYGAAHTFEAICRFLDNGIDKVQHWKTYEVISPAGNKVLFDAEACLYTVFDYCEGWDAKVYDLNAALTDGATGTAMVIKGPSESILILSATHIDRSREAAQHFTFSFDKADVSFDTINEIEKEFLSIDRETSVYDIARDDLEAQGLLNAPYSTDSNRVNRISKMGGNSAKSYLANNWSTYTDHYINSMKLANYSGELTEDDTHYHLEVNAMKTPSIMVFRFRSEVGPAQLMYQMESNDDGESLILSWDSNNLVLEYAEGELAQEAWQPHPQGRSSPVSQPLTADEPPTFFRLTPKP